jgi:sugar phosphate isomerase/epimerase
MNMNDAGNDFTSIHHNWQAADGRKSSTGGCRMKPGYLTSVCPGQTLGELIRTAQKYGYLGIEFRPEWEHRHGVELAASPGQRKEARQRLADAGIAASCIATGVNLNFIDPAAHLPQREKLRKYITLAAEIGAPNIRTFADAVPEDDETARNKMLSLEAESYALLADWAKQHGVNLLVETHTNMRADWARQILDQAGSNNVQVLWHIAHHLRRGQSVDEAYPYIRGHVRHAHFSVMPEKAVTDADNRRMFELLAADKYKGFFSVEVINPENPDTVLMLHMNKYKEFMQGLE